MRISILIPHWKTGKLTASTLHRILQTRGKHQVSVIIIDNNAGDGSAEYIHKVWDGDVIIVDYPKNKLGSHGMAFDYVLEAGLVKDSHFITLESDCYPDDPNWLDYYEDLVGNNVDLAASLLRLSGGTYYHPCGALYRTSLWEESKAYCDNIEYSYFPNLSMKDNFPCHLMVHKSILSQFLDSPEDFIVVSDSYKNEGVISREKFLSQLEWYRPTVNPFHNGMGKNQESYYTYGQRTVESEVPNILLNNVAKLVNRMGYEPGQFLSYYAAATGKKIVNIPAETKWLSNRENVQQEYTRNEAGLVHLWAGSAHLSMKGGEMNDVYEFKKNQIDELYNQLPNRYKIIE